MCHIVAVGEDHSEEAVHFIRSGQQAMADQRRHPRLAQREAQYIANRRRIERRIRLAFDRQHDGAGASEELGCDRTGNQVMRLEQPTITLMLPERVAWRIGGML
jgi:hypothetical protein